MHAILHIQKWLSTVKWAQWDKTHSRELLGLFICVCIALCTIVAHNIAQNRPDNFPSYPPDNHQFTTAPIMSNWGKGGGGNEGTEGVKEKIGHYTLCMLDPRTDSWWKDAGTSMPVHHTHPLNLFKMVTIRNWNTVNIKHLYSIHQHNSTDVTVALQVAIQMHSTRKKSMLKTQ